MTAGEASSRSVDPRPSKTRAAIFASVEGLSARPAVDVTVNAIVREAGVSRSAFYAQFPDLEALAVAMLVETLEEIGTAQPAEASEPLDVPGKIHRLASHIASRRSFYRAGLDWRLTSRVHESIVEAYAVQIGEVIRSLGDSVPPELRHQDAARFLAGGMVTLVTRWLRDEEANASADPQVLTDRLVSVLPGWLTGAA